MKNIDSFSGGRTSAYLVWRGIQSGRTDEVVFCDTGAEHPKTYEFIREVSKRWGVKITCLRGDFNVPLGTGNKPIVVGLDDIGPDLKPFAGEMKKYGVPYMGGGMHCSCRMKERIFRSYCNEKYGRGNYNTWLGIRIDEPKRINLENKMGIRYLSEISDFEKHDVLRWWDDQPFDLGIPEHLGNCVFCPKKSDLKLALAARDEPELYQQWLSCVKSDSVRTGEGAGEWRSMYRKKRSLEQVIAMFSDVETDDVRSRIRGAKMFDTNSCSESCEAIGQIDWVDDASSVAGV